MDEEKGARCKTINPLLVHGGQNYVGFLEILNPAYMLHDVNNVKRNLLVPALAISFDANARSFKGEEVVVLALRTAAAGYIHTL